MITINRILVPTDFSTVADAALDYGRTLAEHFGAGLDVLHVAEHVTAMTVGVEGYVADLANLQGEVEKYARMQLDERVSALSTLRQTTSVVLTSNAPARAIVEYARDHRIDLIVIGTQGRGGLPRLLVGSVAERVVRTAPCPVLTVHHPEREFVLPEPAKVAAQV